MVVYNNARPRSIGNDGNNGIDILYSQGDVHLINKTQNEEESQMPLAFQPCIPFHYAAILEEFGTSPHLGPSPRSSDWSEAGHPGAGVGILRAPPLRVPWGPRARIQASPK